MNGLRQLRDATGGHQVGWKSPTVDDDETASQQRGEEGQTGIEVQCSIAVVHILSRFSTTILIAVNRKHDFDLLTASDLDFGSRLLKI